MKGNYGRGQNIWRPPLHKSRRLSRFKHLHALKSSYRDGNSSTLLTKSCFLSFSALHLFPPSSFPSLFVSCFFFFFVSFGLTKIPRTGGQAVRQLNRKRSFRNRNKKNRKDFNKEKRNPQNKNKKQRTSRSPTKHIYCKLFCFLQQQTEETSTKNSSILLHSFLPSFLHLLLLVFSSCYFSFFSSEEFLWSSGSNFFHE